MGSVRFGTVGYSYRDWAGIFFPPGSPPRRQFNIYAGQFDVCELTQFMHTMPDPERMVGLAGQIRTDLKLFVRLHNSFTHCTDPGLAAPLARHFRAAMEPLHNEGHLAGLVAAFPYAFKCSAENRKYVSQLASMLAFEGNAAPLQVDFRHPSWLAPDTLRWLSENGLALVCVDEPELPGLLPRLAVATAGRVLIRLHGRNAQGWWSGNPATRFDYSYSTGELHGLQESFRALIEAEGLEVSFLFQNNWQAQSISNAIQFRSMITQTAAKVVSPLEAAISAAAFDEETLRPPNSLPMSELKSRVKGALAGLQNPGQGALDLFPRDE